MMFKGKKEINKMESSGADLLSGRLPIRLDLAAALLGVLLFSYFFFIAPRGISNPDETFYFTVPQRLAQGDLLLVHEWGVQQLPFLFLVIPFRIYTAAVGSTEGLMLFSRYFFLAVDLFYYAYMWKKLRRFGVPGLIGTFLFCAVLSPMGLSLTYYSIAPMGMMTVCLILFTGKEEKRPWQLVLCGVALACAILAELLLLLVYMLYAAAVLILLLKRQKGSPAWLCLRCGAWVTLGSFLSFCVFLAYLAFSGALQRMPETFGYLFTSRGYTPTDIVDLTKLTYALRLYGYFFLPAGGVCSLAAFWYSRRKKKDEKLRLRIFILSALLFAACYIHAVVFVLAGLTVRNFDFLVNNGLPVLLFSPVWYFLWEGRDRRLFPFWIVSALSSLMIDIASDVILGSAFGIAQVMGVISFAGLLRELRESPASLKNGRQPDRTVGRRLSRLVLPAAMIGVCVFSLWNVAFISVEGFYELVENVGGAGTGEPLSLTVEIGPCRGLRTTRRVGDLYGAVLRDLDRIKSSGTEKPVYIDGLCPWGYLYLDMPYGVETAFFLPWNRRTGDYLSVFPEKRAEYVYFLMYDLDSYQPRADMTEAEIPLVMKFIFGDAPYEMQAGEAGVIVRLV